MNYLAFDTSGKDLLIVLRYNNKYYEILQERCNLQHSVYLMPGIDHLINLANAKLNEIDVFACCVGAGSFTGIRIGVSCAKSFAYSLQKKVLSITSFDIMTYNNERGKILALVDANHNNYYVCGYENGKVVINPSFFDREQVLSLSNCYKLVSTNKIDDFECELVNKKLGFINAIEKNITKATMNREVLVPLYIKKSQAEENKL